MIKFNYYPKYAWFKFDSFMLKNIGEFTSIIHDQY